MAKDFFDKVNFIVRSFFDPCDAPVSLWVETAAPAALRAIIAYYLFDWWNVLSGAARPSYAQGRLRSQRKGNFGWKGGRMKKRGYLSSLLNFDPGDALGRKLTGAEDLAGRSTQRGVVHLWNFFGQIERFNWWWMVLSLIFDFLFDWFSLLEKHVYCDQQRATVLLATGPGYGTLPVGGWAAAFAPNLEKIRGDATWAITNGSVGGVNATLTFRATAVNHGALSITMGARIAVAGGSTSGAVYESSGIVKPGEATQVLATGKAGQGAVFTIQLYEDSLAGEYTDLEVFAFAEANDE